MLKKLLLISLSLLIVSGCATTDSNDDIVYFPEENKIFSVELYAKLESTKDGYTFTEFSTNRPPSLEEWVNLRTAEPLWSISPRRCGSGLLRDRNEEVEKCSDIIAPELFMDSQFDIGDAFIRVIGAPLTMGLTLTGTSSDIFFNYPRYNEAFSEALNKLDLAQVSWVNQKIGNTTSEIMNIMSVYNKNIHSLRVNLPIKLSDNSGLYANEINFARDIHIISDVQSDFKLSFETLAEVQALDDVIDSHIEALRNQTQIVPLSCPVNAQQRVNYTISYKCPDSLAFIEDAIEGFINVNVHSKTFDRILPHEFTASNEQIMINLENQIISLHNRTPGFIIVNSISFYHNGAIASLEGLNIELAPHSKTSGLPNLNLRNFDLSSNALKFSGVTQKSSENLFVDFGFAVQYESTGQASRNSLYEVETFSLKELI